MRDTCGCSRTHNHPHHNHIEETKTIDVNQSLLKANEEAAAGNKRHFDEKGILAINLISSPGSGKTALLEKTIESPNNEIAVGGL